MRRIFVVNAPEVKPTRNTARPASRFGAGLVRTLPTTRAPFTFSDAQWWAAEQASREDRHYDQLAGQSAAVDRHERGLAC